MKFSEKWLREWVQPSLTTQQLSDQLTMAGLEVAGVSQSGDGQDNLIELDLTPNRGDCLSVMGIAREVGVLTRSAVTYLPTPQVDIKNNNLTFPIQIQAPLDCPRYVGRVIRQIRTAATTPSWLQARLQGSDIACIHPVVDILNYVMLELGQPMHAFDLDKLQAPIIVRHAKEGEKITLLDGQEITLQPKTLVIADKQYPQALAGIMGGQDSKVNEGTQNVFLESAYFAPHLLAGKARRYGLHTDSSFRFERGVDPDLQVLAIERATALMLEIVGGEAGPVLVEGQPWKKPDPITLHYARLKKLLGYAVPETTVVDILQRLGCEVVELNKNPQQDKTWHVQPGSFRSDITSEIDLIEEVVRVFGYNNIPSSMPLTNLQFVHELQTEVPLSRVIRAMVDMGYQEVITYSFVDDTIQQKLFPDEEALALLNPISADMNVMRLSIWPGLLNALKYNQNRQQTRMKLFETGLRFQPKHGKLVQDNVLGALVCGNVAQEQWGIPARAVDFFDVKQHIESLWQLIGQRKPLTFLPTQHSACHPGQCAQITWQGEEVGVIGRLHPKIQKQLELDGPIYLFELSIAAFSKAPMPLFARPSRFTENRRDIAVIVDEHCSSDSLINSVRKSAGELLQEVKVFDVYTGKGIDSGRKSVALGLILQHPSRTLIDQEIDDVVRTIVAGLQAELNAKLRE